MGFCTTDYLKLSLKPNISQYFVPDEVGGEFGSFCMSFVSSKPSINTRES